MTTPLYVLIVRWSFSLCISGLAFVLLGYALIELVAFTKKKLRSR